ncbi:hypothetical protein ACFVKB_38365 [Rhodococcus sp. NPDC127530]|uniref:hypothetical protein n=1 Tax=unclassified Rhodococcus (in: high G+C Gram-positive bacteria) TaxID=192944 RepID=UPI00364340D6
MRSANAALASRPALAERGCPLPGDRTTWTESLTVLSSRSSLATSENPTTARSGTVTLVVALLGFFVITLDTLIVIVALPQIAADIGGGITGL